MQVRGMFFCGGCSCLQGGSVLHPSCFLLSCTFLESFLYPSSSVAAFACTLSSSRITHNRKPLPRRSAVGGMLWTLQMLPLLFLSFQGCHCPLRKVLPESRNAIHPRSSCLDPKSCLSQTGTGEQPGSHIPPRHGRPESQLTLQIQGEQDSDEQGLALCLVCISGVSRDKV